MKRRCTPSRSSLASSPPPSPSPSSCSGRWSFRQNTLSPLLGTESVEQHRVDLVARRILRHPRGWPREHVMEPLLAGCLLVRPQKVRQNTQRLFRSLNRLVTNAKLEPPFRFVDRNGERERDGHHAAYALAVRCGRIELACQLQPRATLLGIDVRSVNHNVVASKQRCACSVDHGVSIAKLVLVAPTPVAEMLHQRPGERRLATPDQARQHQHVLFTRRIVPRWLRGLSGWSGRENGCRMHVGRRRWWEERRKGSSREQSCRCAISSTAPPVRGTTSKKTQNVRLRDRKHVTRSFLRSLCRASSSAIFFAHRLASASLLRSTCSTCFSTPYSRPGHRKHTI